jgi:hypothetical protein
VYAETSKMKIPGLEYQGITMPNKIQPGEYSMGGGMGGIPYNSDGDPNLLNVNRDGRWLNANYDNPDNQWNRDNGFAFVVSQISSFSPIIYLLGGVLF